jgi:hypothetical protein
MKGILTTDQDRTTTRNFRIPLSLDDKILELNKELGHSTITETWIYLVKIGMEKEDNLKKLEDVAIKPEVQGELKEKCEGLTDVEAVAHTLTTMSDKYVHFLKGMIAIEEERREMERKEERQRKAKAAFELNKKMRAAGIGY